MCLIVDANAAAEFLAKSGPVTQWLLGEKGEPRLVAAGKLITELVRVDKVQQLLAELNRAGRLRPVDADQLQQEVDRLRANSRRRSNDSHVLALAVVTGARTLAIFDNALSQDFKNAGLISRPRGSIYRDPAKHSHLLRHTPTSCGVRPSADRPRRTAG